MKRVSLALLVTLSSGCAGGYRASYVTGAVVKQMATESYDVYSDLFNQRLDECDPAANELVTTKSALDECMGGAYNSATHNKIEKAAEVYYNSAKIHSDIMIAVDASPEEMSDATKGILRSAVNLLGLFPGGDKLVSKLKKLTGGM